MNIPGELIVTAPLWLLFMIGMFVAVRSPIQKQSAGRILTIGWLTLLLQLVHVIEEFENGFHRLMPQIWGLDGWSNAFFLMFNSAWIALWAMSLVALARGTAPVISAGMLWFLGLAAGINGLVHPALSIATGEYFPGLFSAIPLGIAGLMLCRALLSPGPLRRHD